MAACSLGRHTSSPPEGKAIKRDFFLLGQQCNSYNSRFLHPLRDPKKTLLIPVSVPEVSADVPWTRLNRFPQALLIAAILAMIGRLWITKATSFLCCAARLLAWPSNPKPVTSVAAWAWNLCIRPAAGDGDGNVNEQVRLKNVRSHKETSAGPKPLLKRSTRSNMFSASN